MSKRYFIATFKVLWLFVGCFAIVWAADYVMKDGDTLGALSLQHYGSASYWTALQWYNGVGNERTIPIGTPINFPDKAKLDQVKQILARTQSTAERSQQIAALGGQTNPVPPPPAVNAGLGKPISYDAIGGLGLQRVIR